MLELDACCGYRHMWKNKNTSNVIFIDIKREVKPTIVASAKHLPFRDKIFDKIYCDPPHIIRSDTKNMKLGQTHSDFAKMYGSWKNRSEWIAFVGRTNIEFKRILKDNGILWYKITSGGWQNVDILDLNYMDNFKIIEKRIFPTKGKMIWKKSITYEVILKIKGKT